MNTFMNNEEIIAYDVNYKIEIKTNSYFDFNIQDSNVGFGIYRKETLRGFF